MDSFRDRLARVEENISAACRRAARRREEVRLMAVSKTHPASAIVEAVSAGMTLFGENRVQEFQNKSQELSQICGTGPEVHLIGHLQTNKAAKAAELFAGVDTVDSLRLAERLNAAAQQFGRSVTVLLEVKLSHEAAKTGLDPDGTELRELLERLPDLHHLQMRGMMTVAPFSDDPAIACEAFRRLRNLREKLSGEYPRLGWDELSMGMSSDFELAIEEGSTLVRIGTALFGAREPQH